MVGIELVRDRDTKEPFPPELRTGWQVCRAAAARGLRVRPLGDVLVLMPTLGIAESELDFLVERLSLALADVVPAASRKSP
jgi:adenosylmethionine-8-amino-7-oxononanoate aminotransferase